MSTQRRSSVKHFKDADGKTLCSCGCGRHPVYPRRNWFSKECVDEWLIRNHPSHVRHAVKARDKCVCAICGIDTEAERRKYHAALVQHYMALVPKERQRPWMDGETVEKLSLRDAPKPPEGFPGLGRSWWEADHIVPVVEGGGQCGLDNYRTLCCPCHKRVTRELHARLKAKRALLKRAEVE